MPTAVRQVRDYWQQQPCGSQNSQQPRYSLQYFEEIEAHRYSFEPEIFSFAQFTRYRGKRVLEVGIGAATDFLQWVRAGTEAYGVDLTQEAVDHALARLDAYGLRAAELRVASAEMLPYDDNSFDLVYSWGVLHHTPDTRKAVEEVVRVTRPGGTCKIMLYHRRSLVAFYEWCKWALLKGRPWKSISWCMARCVESPGTKAFTRSEVDQMLRRMPVAGLRIGTILTQQDRLYRFPAVFGRAAEVVALIAGRNRLGWYTTIEFNKEKR